MKTFSDSRHAAPARRPAASPDMAHGTTGSGSPHARDVAQRERIDSAFGGPVQRVDDEDELQRKASGAFQLQEDDEEPLQGRFGAAQRQDTEEEEPLQARAEAGPALAPPTAASSPGGLPVGLRQGIESLSGMDLSDVRVHTGSSKPAEFQALAYAQGNEIHVAPGQEQHLAHEAWHVVQQRQGRVQPTMRLRGGVPVNDDVRLEHEAEVTGAKAQINGGMRESRPDSSSRVSRTNPSLGCIQRVLGGSLEKITESYLSRFQAAFGQLKNYRNRVAVLEFLKSKHAGDVKSDDDLWLALPRAMSALGLQVAPQEAGLQVGTQDAPQVGPRVAPRVAPPAPHVAPPAPQVRPQDAPHVGPRVAAHIAPPASQVRPQDAPQVRPRVARHAAPPAPQIVPQVGPHVAPLVAPQVGPPLALNAPGKHNVVPSPRGQAALSQETINIPATLTIRNMFRGDGADKATLRGRGGFRPGRQAEGYLDKLRAFLPTLNAIESEKASRYAINRERGIDIAQGGRPTDFVTSNEVIRIGNEKPLILLNWVCAGTDTGAGVVTYMIRVEETLHCVSASPSIGMYEGGGMTIMAISLGSSQRENNYARFTEFDFLTPIPPDRIYYQSPDGGVTQANSGGWYRLDDASPR